MHITISNEIRRALDLTIIQYVVMEYITIKATEAGYAKPKDDIAKSLGLSRNVVYLSIKVLENKDLLAKSNGGRTLMPTAKWNNMFKPKDIQEVESLDFKKSQPLECYFDGACEPINPGGNMGMGWLIVNTRTGHVRKRMRYKKGHPTNSNNVSEYLALYMLLKDLRDYTSCDISIYGDSKLVVNQINDEWELNSGLHYNIAKRTVELYNEIITKNIVNIKWIPRERNTGADALTREALETLYKREKSNKFVKN